MNLVSPARFNELRFTQDPIPNAKLWRWCRNKVLPARKIGGEWFIDLDAFDRGQKEPENQVPARVVQLLAARVNR